VSHIAISPDATAAACASGKTVTVLRVGSTGDAVSSGTLPALPSTVESLRYDARGNLLASYYGGVTFWNFAERGSEQAQALDLQYMGACLAADVSRSAEWVVAGCHDATVHIFHMTPGDAGVAVQVGGMSACVCGRVCAYAMLRLPEAPLLARRIQIQIETNTPYNQQWAWSHWPLMRAIASCRS
jgi:hypothetical protein